MSKRKRSSVQEPEPAVKKARILHEDYDLIFKLPELVTNILQYLIDDCVTFLNVRASSKWHRDFVLTTALWRNVGLNERVYNEHSDSITLSRLRYILEQLRIKRLLRQLRTDLTLDDATRVEMYKKCVNTDRSGSPFSESEQLRLNAFEHEFICNKWLTGPACIQFIQILNRTESNALALEDLVHFVTCTQKDLENNSEMDKIPQRLKFLTKAAYDVDSQVSYNYTNIDDHWYSLFHCEATHGHLIFRMEVCKRFIGQNKSLVLIYSEYSPAYIDKGHVSYLFIKVDHEKNVIESIGDLEAYMTFRFEFSHQGFNEALAALLEIKYDPDMLIQVWAIKEFAKLNMEYPWDFRSAPDVAANEENFTEQIPFKKLLGSELLKLNFEETKRPILAQADFFKTRPKSIIKVQCGLNSLMSHGLMLHG